MQIKCSHLCNSASRLCRTLSIALIGAQFLSAPILVAGLSEPAWANNNGNGNGNGRSNRGNGNKDRSERGNSANNRNDGGNRGNSHGSGSGNRDRGTGNSSNQTTNASSQTAIIPGVAYSTSENLIDYRRTYQKFVEVVTIQNQHYDRYEQLSLLTPEEAQQHFPNGDYVTQLQQAESSYLAARYQAELAQTAAGQSLGRLTGGQHINDQQVQQIHKHLGL